jgi:hypothetical protein
MPKRFAVLFAATTALVIPTAGAFAAPPRSPGEGRYSYRRASMGVRAAARLAG